MLDYGTDYGTRLTDLPEEDREAALITPDLSADEVAALADADSEVVTAEAADDAEEAE